MTEELSDRDLVHQVLTRGDQLAFRRLYRRHTPRLLRLAGNLTADREIDADDLVQETWIRAVARLGDFEWRSSLITWLAGILVNRTRETYRSLRRAEFVGLTEDVGPWPDPPDVVERLELERAIAQLAPGARTVLILHDVEGYTHEEIALLLEISAGTSKSQLSRARRAVVNHLTSERRNPTHART